MKVVKAKYWVAMVLAMTAMAGLVPAEELASAGVPSEATVAGVAPATEEPKWGYDGEGGAPEVITNTKPEVAVVKDNHAKQAQQVKKGHKGRTVKPKQAVMPEYDSQVADRVANGSDN